MQVYRAVLVFCFLSIIISCNTIKSPLFGKRSAREKYADAITTAGLNESALGRAWFRAGDKALAQPQTVTLPYKETGFFAADQPSGAGYSFSVTRGENIVVTLSSNPDSVQVFVELWQPGNQKPSLRTAMDTLSKDLKFTATKNDSFIVRIQPELLVDLEYTITITTQPSLAFPVDKSGNPRLISFWGNERDNGARDHEGVDIGAKFRTPALAAANGIISRVTLNNLGGKVVFLRDENTGNNLYYAHLDSQIAVTGQKVTIGDTIGLVGKTGNARNTVPHLHFGIYTIGGAVDPLPFINTNTKEPGKITAPTQYINRFLRTTSSGLYREPAAKSSKEPVIEKNEIVFVLAATGDWYKVKLPNDTIGYINSRSLTDKILDKLLLTDDQKLRVKPLADSPSKRLLAAGEKVDVMGGYHNFYFVNFKGIEGWIARPE